MRDLACPGCGHVFPDASGPTHDYIESSPGCWAAYGQVLAREYGDPGYRAAHRLTVDAYAAQHPGSSSARAVQSVGVHLIGLHLMLDRGYGADATTAAMRQTAVAHTFTWLAPPLLRGGMTIADILAARNPQEHIECVRRWAAEVWAAWSEHHATVRAWVAGPPHSSRAK